MKYSHLFALIFDTDHPKLPMSHRKIPWTKEETDALLHGLKKGLCGSWNAILRLHGAGGEISQVLRGRTNVQLKDRARTLRGLYGGKDIPWYLTSTSPDSVDELSNTEHQASASLSEQDGRCHEVHPLPTPLRQTVVLNEFIGHVLGGLCRNFAGPDALLHNDNVNKLLGSAYDFGWDGKVEHMEIDDWYGVRNHSCHIRTDR